jgi:hypothetical protein
MTTTTTSPAPAGAKTSGLAIASLVCGIAGLCTAGLGSIVGLILGLMALKKIGDSGGRVGGRGLAIAGLAVSVVTVLLWIAAVVVAAFVALLRLGSVEERRPLPPEAPSVIASPATPSLPTLPAAPVPPDVEALLQGSLNQAQTRVMLETVRVQLELYHVHRGRYPTVEEGGLSALVKPWPVPGSPGESYGPYLRELPRDAWGHALNYEPAPGPPGYRLWSSGPDGASGTADDIVAGPR